MAKASNPIDPDRSPRSIRPRQGKLGVLYENRDWLEDFFQQLDDHRIPFEPVRLDQAEFLLDDPDRFTLYLNRTSPSSYIRGHGPAIPFALAFMEALEDAGKKVINGVRSFRLETSKVAQSLLLKRLGVKTPRTLVFNHRFEVEDLGEFRFPAILKPNTGGSGAFVRKVESRAHLQALLHSEEDVFGPDHLLLLQEYIESGDGSVVRTEFVDGEFLFAMRVRAVNTFNLCPADSCERHAADQGAALPPRVDFDLLDDIPVDAVAQAREIVREARLDVGGVEYIETASGDRYFYDINASSVYRNEICDAANVDALGKFIGFVQREHAKELIKENHQGRAAAG